MDFIALPSSQARLPTTVRGENYQHLCGHLHEASVISGVLLELKDFCPHDRRTTDLSPRHTVRSLCSVEHPGQESSSLPHQELGLFPFCLGLLGTTLLQDMEARECLHCHLLWNPTRMELKRAGAERGEKHELERPGREKPEVQAGRVREKDERTR